MQGYVQYVISESVSDVATDTNVGRYGNFTNANSFDYLVSSLKNDIMKNILWP